MRRFALVSLIAAAVTIVLVASMLGTGIYKRHRWNAQQRKGDDSKKQYHWEHYPR